MAGFKTLNSWKEIAAYLGRGVRTVQRWERDLGLPIHRESEHLRSPVYALTAELDEWIRRGTGARKPKHSAEITSKMVRNAAIFAQNLEQTQQRLQRLTETVSRTINRRPK